MAGAGHAQVTDRDAFLKGAMNVKIKANEDLSAPPDGLVSIQRPGTVPYGGRKKTVKKKKKKTTKTTNDPAPALTDEQMAAIPAISNSVDASPIAKPVGYTQPAYEDPDNPSLDDIERAKEILAAAQKAGSPFVPQPATQGGPVDAFAEPEVAHTAVASEFQIDDIDDDTEAAPPKKVEDEVVDETPDYLKEHDCGLPECLMLKKPLIKYLVTHSIDQVMRESLEITDPERALYEKYTREAKMRRVTLGHFICALRMWRNGYPVNPKESIDMNSMKVEV